MIALALLLQVAAPSPDLSLARRVAESGALVRLLPVIGAKEADEMVNSHPELTRAEADVVRQTATELAAKGRERIVAATAPIYASTLSIEQMQAIVAYEDSPAAAARRGAELSAMIAAGKSLDGYDFKRDVLTAVCAKIGKACPEK